MSLPWFILQHTPDEGPGLIAPEMRAREIPFTVRRLYEGDDVPGVAELSGLIVLGGPMNALDDAGHPHLRRERELLAATVEAGRPILAICLGSQLLTAALGARIFRGPREEIGLGEVTLTADGSADPVLGDAGPVIPVCHWHGDTFDLPRGATLLASSALYPNQGYRVGTRVYALQFHIELDADLLRAWLPAFPPEARIDVARQPMMERAGRGIIGRFLDLARRPAAAVSGAQARASS
jgi:GMP synthase-like glutamine amidotransferase